LKTGELNCLYSSRKKEQSTRIYEAFGGKGPLVLKGMIDIFRKYPVFPRICAYLFRKSKARFLPIVVCNREKVRHKSHHSLLKKEEIRLIILLKSAILSKVAFKIQKSCIMTIILFK